MWFIQNNIPTIYTKVVLDLLAESGFHPSSILRGTGVELSAIADPESKINLEQQLAIYGNALSVSNVAGLGLLQGQRMLPNHLGIVGYAIQTSANLRQALRTLVSYSTVSGALLDIQLQRQNDLQILSVTNVYARGNLRQYIVEEHLATIDHILKIITNGKFTSSTITLDYPPPNWTSMYDEIFKCSIEFDQPLITYQFDSRMLELDVVLSDPETAKACEQKCEEIVRKMNSAGSYIDKIRQIILMLPCNSRNLSSVAEELEISPRSLRRKLAVEETTFQGLLDEVRHELAIQYLKNTRLASEEIAHLLGFSDGAAFRHAFKKWAGLSPGVYRKQTL
jgi:AraC-like DNA-binding protein